MLLWHCFCSAMVHCIFFFFFFSSFFIVFLIFCGLGAVPSVAEISDFAYIIGKVFLVVRSWARPSLIFLSWREQRSKDLSLDFRLTFLFSLSRTTTFQMTNSGSCRSFLLQLLILLLSTLLPGMAQLITSKC